MINKEKQVVKEEMRKFLAADREAVEKINKHVKNVFFNSFVPIIDDEKVDWNKKLLCGHSTLLAWVERSHWLDRGLENISIKIKNKGISNDKEIFNALVESNEIPNKIQVDCDYSDERLINPHLRMCGRSYSLKLIPKI